jgi:antitoxin (DNA-binding transcriptional repressor) of toxin-antitoxin stability system
MDVRTYVRYLLGMAKTATELRAHLYEVLDQVAKTGRPVTIIRGGVELSIIRSERKAKGKAKAAPRKIPDLIVGDPDELIHVEWPWNRGKGL